MSELEKELLGMLKKLLARGTGCPWYDKDCTAEQCVEHRAILQRVKQIEGGTW